MSWSTFNNCLSWAALELRMQHEALNVEMEKPKGYVRNLPTIAPLIKEIREGQRTQVRTRHACARTRHAHCLHLVCKP